MRGAGTGVSSLSRWCPERFRQRIGDRERDRFDLSRCAEGTLPRGTPGTSARYRDLEDGGGFPRGQRLGVAWQQDEAAFFERTSIGGSERAFHDGEDREPAGIRIRDRSACLK